MKESLNDLPKLEKQTTTLQENQNLLMSVVPKKQQPTVKTEQCITDQNLCVSDVDMFHAPVERPSPPLTPSLDPELLRRLEAEDTPRRVLRASTIAVTKSSLARKENGSVRQKRKATDSDRQVRRGMPRKSKTVGNNFDTPIEDKIAEESSACTPSSSGVSSMSSSTSSSGSTKSKRRRKTQLKINSNWRPVTTGEKHYVYNSNDNAPVKRLCFPAVQHVREPETIRLYDAVIVNSEDGSRNIGKIARIFLDDSTGLLMATVFWYYASEQVEIDPKHIDPPILPRELLASRHIDMIPIDTIQEVVYVLTVNEYSRYVAENKSDALPREQRPKVEDEVWPRAEDSYFRRSCLPCEDSLPELVFFCRRIYDFKQKRIIVNRRSIVRRSVPKKGLRRSHRNRHSKFVDPVVAEVSSSPDVFSRLVVVQVGFVVFRGSGSDVVIALPILRFLSSAMLCVVIIIVGFCRLICFQSLGGN
uniref:BAH domain-containing protein n=1 Tax=Syphacia muris TaxID=451379 RepID=A0A0N5AYR8_9BILA